MDKEQINNKFLETEFKNYLESLGYSDITPSNNKSTVYDYSLRIRRICEREKLTWYSLAVNITKIIEKYDTNGIEEEYGKEGKRSVINALKKYKEFVIDIDLIKNRQFMIVDLFSGSYNNNHLGHELFNEIPNVIDGRFYGYIPDYDNPNVDELGAKKDDEFVDDILVIFVRKISDENKNRIVTGFYPKARVHRKRISDNKLNRSFPDKDGSIKIATYSVESDDYVKVFQDNTFVIEIEKYSSWMFRKQRVYRGKYPELDKEILRFIDSFDAELIDDDFDMQSGIQSITEALESSVTNAPNRPVITDNSPRGKTVRRDPRLSKTAIINANYLCEVDGNHSTFLNTNNKPYMEGHHLIPCTVKNANFIWEIYQKNIDCVENIVSLCPNCHREIHFANKETKVEIITKLFDKFKSKLEKINIHITLNELLDFYGVLTK